MSSEIIVVLVLIALAVGFIIWVRVHSQAQNSKPHGDTVGQQRGPAEKS